MSKEIKTKYDREGCQWFFKIVWWKRLIFWLRGYRLSWVQPWRYKCLFCPYTEISIYREGFKRKVAGVYCPSHYDRRKGGCEWKTKYVVEWNDWKPGEVFLPRVGCDPNPVSGEE